MRRQKDFFKLQHQLSEPKAAKQTKQTKLATATTTTTTAAKPLPPLAALPFPMPSTIQSQFNCCCRTLGG